MSDKHVFPGDDHDASYEVRYAKVAMYLTETPHLFEKHVLQGLLNAAEKLEEESTNYTTFSENQINCIIAGMIEQIGLTVSRESQCRGHTDIYIKASLPFRKFSAICEGKIRGSMTDHKDACSQLIQNYTSAGQQLFGVVLLYFKTPESSRRMAEAREDMKTQPENWCHPTNLRDNDFGRFGAYLADHPISSARNLTVYHFPIDLSYPGTRASAEEQYRNIYG